MSRNAALAVVVMLTLVGLALRLHRLDHVPLRGDEAYSVQYWARQPIVLTLTTTATAEPHPPLTYLLFRWWGLLAGTGVFSMRMLPALVSVVGIPALYVLGLRLGNRLTGILAAAFWTIHPFQIWHAQDARNYALWAALSAVGVWLALRAVERGRRLDWTLYGVVAATTAFIFYLEVFTVAALTVYVLVTQWRNRRTLFTWFVLHGAITAALFAVFWVLQGRLLLSGDYGGTTGGFDASQWLTRFLPTLVFGDTLPRAFVSWLWVILLLVMLVALAVQWRTDRKRALLLTSLAVLPLLLLGVVSLRLNVFRPRYVMIAAPAYVLLLTLLVQAITTRLSSKSLRVGLGILLVAPVIGVSTYSLYNYFYVVDYAKSPNWTALTDYLSTHADDDDLVIQTAVDAAFGYYYNAPAVNIGLPERPEQAVEDIVATLEDARDIYDSVWVVAQTFPDWANYGVVEDWTQNNMQLVRRTAADGLRIEEFKQWEVAPTEYGDPIATIGDVVEVIGVEVFPIEPTDDLTVWVYWRPLQTSDQPLTAFVHLIGEVNPATGTPLWSQQDHPPQNGRISTTNWTSGTVYRDVYSLPVRDAPPGDYALSLGMYTPDGVRLDVFAPDGNKIGDALHAADVTIQ